MHYQCWIEEFGGMSDLSMYELEDINWDDFDRGDDHIVPHPTNARTCRNSFEGDSCKKPRRETNTGNLDCSNTIFQKKEERESKPLDKKKNVMEKESTSHAPAFVFNASCNGEIVKDMPNLASDDTRMSNNCFRSSYTLSGATSATGDNNSYSYPLTHVTQEGELCFVDNSCENKESGDLLYYSWPDIGNFEDVDKMLRSCDSSFGLGVPDNDDELSWFTSDQIEGNEEALKMDLKFPCTEPSGLKDILPDLGSGTPESSNHRSSCISESNNECSFKDQKKQSKHQNQMEGKIIGKGVENDGSFYQISDLTSNDSRLSSDNKFDQTFTCVGNEQQYRNLELDCFGQMQSNTSYLPPNYHHQPTTGQMLSNIKSEHKGQMMFQSSKGVMVSAEKPAHLSGNELESQSDMKGAEIGSLNVPESASVSSQLNEISLEATSFRQLRHVMEQLDLRTKLCIRDSLYRLARSAEQRHNNPSLSSGATDINDLGGPLVADRSNKCSGFMDIETDTNPIDRSVAHLLFHRPSESPNLPPKSNLNHGSVAGPSMMAEKLVSQEEAAAESNDN